MRCSGGAGGPGAVTDASWVFVTQARCYNMIIVIFSFVLTHQQQQQRQQHRLRLAAVAVLMSVPLIQPSALLHDGEKPVSVAELVLNRLSPVTKVWPQVQLRSSSLPLEVAKFG